MTHREPTLPLDPEERALAERLARLGPHGEPSPALDARVLAAAHAGTMPARPTRRHWSLPLGVAASVALALGLAWQLRPLPGADPGHSMAPAPAPARETAPEAAPSPVVATRAMAPARPESRSRPAAKQADAPAASQVRAPVAPPPPAPPAPPPPAEEPAVVFEVAAPPPQAMRAQAAVQADQADAPEADVPPATVASPEVRVAWLERIRTLAAAGHADEARASLQEFQRRYPDFALPDDLRPLLP
jgi:hypothetical protein